MNSRSPQVYYGGEIKGESAMKSLDDIGTSVIHTFQVINDGPGRTPRVDVFIGIFLYFFTTWRVFKLNPERTPYFY